MANIDRSPALRPSNLVPAGRSSVTTRLTELAEEVGGRILWCGSGKAALRDAFRIGDFSPGANVLLPAYVPDGIVEPIRDAGLETRYYALTGKLRPEMDSIVEALDGMTAAIVAIHYFGFGQPAFESLRELADRHDCLLIEDSAHSALSTDRRGRLFGTRADLGVTSLPKTLPVPNGGVLFVTNPDLVRNIPNARLANTRRIPSSADLGFLGRELLAPMARRIPGPISPMLPSSPTISGNNPDTGNHTRNRDPRAIYERAIAPMSIVSKYVASHTDASSLVGARRSAYAEWVNVFTDRSDITVLHEDLPDGIAPQCCPIVVDHPSRVERELRSSGVYGADPWAPLPEEVVADDRFEFSHDLSNRLLTLPAHQDVRPSVVRCVGRDLR